MIMKCSQQKQCATMQTCDNTIKMHNFIVFLLSSCKLLILGRHFSFKVTPNS